ncbi:transcriptional repressor [candidate division WOR-3 bacterium]|nr:transcriptional repressor [candidate division WOR-3 bacterium]
MDNILSIEKILRRSKIPLMASEIRCKCHKKPDLATIYRNLKKLEKKGTIGVYPSEDRAKRYYFIEQKNMCYISCEICNKMRKYEKPSLQGLIKKVKKDAHFSTEYVLLVLKGVCDECKTRNLSKIKRNFSR